jgi:hypothetical protein
VSESFVHVESESFESVDNYLLESLSESVLTESESFVDVVLAGSEIEVVARLLSGLCLRPVILILILHWLRVTLLSCLKLACVYCIQVESLRSSSGPPRA